MFALRPRARRLRYGFDYGRLVRERGRFAVNEALNRDKIARYHLRDGGMSFSLRHHTSRDGTPSNDTWTLREIFALDCYLPPPGVEAVLSRAGEELRIVDLGANIGLFTALMLTRYPQARIHAFEPDPESAALLRDALDGAVGGSRCVLHEACARAQDGTTRFAHGRHQFSHIAVGDEVRVTEIPAVDVFPHWRDAHLAKVDIEGGEWELLADERLAEAGPRTMVMEYHSQLCPEPDPRALAERLLRGHGYDIVEAASRPDEPILWAVRRGG
jgi:FkbM family methyltransferase